MIAARPYNRKLNDILDNLLASIGDQSHELFQPHEAVRRIKVVVFSSDRGLCGSFNSSINRRLDTFMRENASIEVELVTIGRKVRDYARRRSYKVAGENPNIPPVQFDKLARELSLVLVREFELERADEVHLLYNQFRSAISQVVVIEQLLPLVQPTRAGVAEPGSLIDFVYEPSQGAILDVLLPQLVANRIMQALLESHASEHGARMAAMDSATRNASEVIDRLTLEYNRARQAAITKELVEIVSGAEAL